MLTVSNLSVQFGKRILFDEVNVTFTQGNCYGIIGANGAGKSTFLKIISGEVDPTSGRVFLEPGKRMSVLNQNHNMFDEHTVLETVLMGNKVLHAIKAEMDALYLDYTDENADRIGELQLQFDEMNGWNAESDAGSMLSNLGITADYHFTPMSELEGKLKVRVLLAQALFGNPDVLIMDEPTNDLDIVTLNVLESFLLDFPGNLLVVSHDRYFMDKIVDHLFVFRGEGEVEDFPGNYSDFRAYEDSADVQQKEDNKAEKKDWKQQNVTTGLSFNEQKEYQKIEREIKDLEFEKAKIEQLFTDGKVADDAIEKKANELQNIIKKMEAKEERWFELSAKMEG